MSFEEWFDEGIVNATPVEWTETGGGFGEAAMGEWRPAAGRAPFPCFPYQENAAQQVRAGRETAASTYRVFCPLRDGAPPTNFREHLQIPGAGRVEVTAVVKYPTEGFCRADAVLREV